MATLVPVDDDPFADMPKASSKTKLVPVDDDPFAVKAKDGKPGVLDDIAKAVPSGLARGVAGIAGLPGTLQSGVNFATDQTVGRLANRLTKGTWDVPELAPRSLPDVGAGSVLSPGKIQGAMEAAIGSPLYKAQTMPGQYAETISEFAPGAVLGVGSLPQRAAQVIIPAITSETAGQVTKGSSMEPYARLGGALVGSGLTALAQRPASTDVVLGKSMKGVDPAAIDDAAKLIGEAKKIGVDLTWDEALSHVTGGATKQLTNVRRVAENTEGGSSILNPMMAERPGQVASAADSAIGDIAPQKMDPYRTGLDTQKAAVGATTRVNQGINAAESPYYTAASMKAVPGQDLQYISQEPAFKRALDAVRSDPDLGRNLEGFKVTDVPVLMEVRKKMADEVNSLMKPAMGSGLNPDRAAAARIQPMVDRLDQIITTSAPEYGQALGVGAGLRDAQMAPLKAGPVGDISKTSDVLQQGNAILPSRPASGSEGAISDAVKRLAAEDPKATQNLIHTQLRTAFDEASQNLQSGENKFGGAKFASVIRGNGQQAKNLEAAVRALPDGDTKWQGLNRFLNVMEATGQAPAQGSMTSFNQAIREKMANGGLGMDAKNAAVTGGVSIFKRLNKFFDEMSAEKNSLQIAKILTDPSSGRVLKQMAELPPGSTKAPLLALRLSYMGRASRSNSGGQEP